MAGLKSTRDLRTKCQCRKVPNVKSEGRKIRQTLFGCRGFGRPLQEASDNAPARPFQLFMARYL